MRIGTFAHAGQVSIRMLRHYDELDLLKPVRVDPETGYRHYAAHQLPMLRRLRTLRELGFGLEEVRELLDSAVSHEVRLARLRKRRDDQCRRVAEEQARLRRLERYLHALKQEDTMTLTTNIEIRSFPAQRVASLRDASLVKPNDGGGLDMSAMWHLLYERLPGALRETGTAVLWHESGRDGTLEPELVHPLAADAAAPAPFQTKLLPAVDQAVSLTYHGHYADQGMRLAFEAVHRWAEDQDYRVFGPTHQVFRGGEIVAGQERMTIDLYLPVTR